MIKLDELKEVIKDILPEGDAGDKAIERIMAIDVYPDATVDPGPGYVKAEELDKARADYSQRIRDIFFGGKPAEGETQTQTEPKQELNLDPGDLEEDFSLSKL